MFKRSLTTKVAFLREGNAEVVVSAAKAVRQKGGKGQNVVTCQPVLEQTGNHVTVRRDPEFVSFEDRK